MQSKAKTAKEYLASLPEDRREALVAIRDVINKNLPKGYEEGIQYGMLSWFIPHSVYPSGYHCDAKQPVPFAAVASQKNYMSLYLMCVYGMDDHREWFVNAWKKSGKKLDMGKACVRFKKLEDVPLDVLGKAIKRVSVKAYLAHYESVIVGGGGRAAGKKKATKKAAVKKKAKR